MSIVSNFVGSLSPEMFSDSVKGITKNIDMDDTTFSDLLEKQINSNLQKNQQNFINNLGLPSITNIIDADEIFSQHNLYANKELGGNSDMLDSIKPINESENPSLGSSPEEKDMSTSEVVTFFSSLFDSKPTLTDTSNCGLFNFERKVAAGEYDKYARNIITDLNEFVSDTIKMKS